jgi:hypothetical protein
LFGASLALAAYAGGAAYMLAEEVVIDPAEKARDHLDEWEVDTRFDTFGSRSWPGLVLRYEGALPFYAEAGYSLRQYEHYQAGVEAGNDATEVQVMGRYRRMRQPHFWGIGPESREDDRSDYQHDQGIVGAGGRWRPSGTPFILAAGVAWERNVVDGHGWDSSRPNTGDVFEGSDLFGLDERTEFVRFEAGAVMDRTHIEHLQVRGWGIEGRWQYFDGVDDTDASFHRVYGDLRAYVPANDRQLAALRILAEDQLGESGLGVPFTHLADLGDERGLRGYSGGRFRDRALLAAQLEWRYEVYWHPGFVTQRIEGFLFTDAGVVGPSLDAVEWSDVEATPGIGLRYVKEGEAKFEAYLARGGSSWRVGVGLGRTF